MPAPLEGSTDETTEGLISPRFVPQSSTSGSSIARNTLTSHNLFMHSAIGHEVTSVNSLHAYRSIYDLRNPGPDTENHGSRVRGVSGCHTNATPLFSPTQMFEQTGGSAVGNVVEYRAAVRPNRSTV
ncbi:hypothetical protein NMY22_g17121 [Coprinellus aureogranulatus]|nr:hypothetical protein NMY22_g17121 [Coprinellus aureogranulatus]